MHVIAVLVAGGFVTAGCCTKQIETIEAHEGQIADLETEVEELEAALDECEGGREALADELEELKGTKAELEGMSTELSEAKKIIDEMKKKQALAQKRLATLKNMLGKFKELIDTGQLSVKIRKGKMVLELPSAILFKSGRSDLSKKGKGTLAEVAKVLATIEDREFQVAGHTDNVPIGKDSKYETNWHLSAARAVSVVLFLQEEGVDPKNLSGSGYSKYQPAASNKSKEGKKKNRRIEITLMPNLDELPDLSDLEKEL
jgi:chemotaxis protein MotB